MTFSRAAAHDALLLLGWQTLAHVQMLRAAWQSRYARRSCAASPRCSDRRRAAREASRAGSSGFRCDQRLYRAAFRRASTRFSSSARATATTIVRSACLTRSSSGRRTAWTTTGSRCREPSARGAITGSDTARRCRRHGRVRELGEADRAQASARSRRRGGQRPASRPRRARAVHRRW